MGFLIYQRGKMSYSRKEGDEVIARAVEEDPLFSGEVEVRFRLPHLEVVSVKGELRHCLDEACRRSLPSLNRLVGKKLGDGGFGWLKAVLGDGGEHCPILLRLLIESCTWLPRRVERFPHDEFLTGKIDYEELLRSMLQNGRFKVLNSCLFWREDNPVVKRLRGQE